MGRRLRFLPRCQLSQAVTPSLGLGFLAVDQRVRLAIFPGPADQYRLCGTEILSATLHRSLEWSLVGAVLKCTWDFVLFFRWGEANKSGDDCH